MHQRSFVFLCLFLLSALTDCNCEDQLGSVLGEIELSLCDRGESCGCHLLSGSDEIIDFGTVAEGMTARRILRIENANQPRKLIIKNIVVQDAVGVFRLGTISKFSALPDQTDDDIQISTHDFATGDLVLTQTEYAEVFLDFIAPTEAEFSGKVTVVSNSRTREEWTVNLRAGAGTSTICLPSGDCGDGSVLDFGTFSDDEVGPDLADPLGRPIALGGEIITVTNTGSGEVLVAVELTNDGIPETLTGELVGANGVFFLKETGCLIVGPGETLEVPVEYRPSTAGEHHGEVVIAGLGTPVRVDLTGRVIGPHICFRTEDDEPLDALLQFGTAPSYFTAQNVTETRKIWASNCGYEANLDITSVSATTQSSEEFSSPSIPWTTQTLGVGEETEIVVTFAPNIANALGSTSSGRYLFETNDTFRPTSAVDLMARIGQPERCVLVPSPSPVDFGWVAQDEAGVGQDCDSLPIPIPGCQELISRVMEVTFTNVGQRPCTNVTLASIVADVNSTDMFHYHPSNSAPAPFTLGAGESSAAITLLFKRAPADVAGDHFANLPYTYSEMSGQQEVLLKTRAGGSPDCAVTFQPTSPPTLFCNADSLNFGNVNIGQEKTIELKVINSGSAECIVNNIQTSNTTSGVFSFSSTELPGTIPVNDFRTVQVHFEPVPPSGNNPFEELPFLCAMNQLDFTVNSGPNASFQSESVALAGKGTRPDIDVIPGQIDFGLVTVGCCSDWERVAIYNSGDGTLTINSLNILGTSDSGFETTQPSNMSLTPGTSTEFEVRYCATAVGQFTGVVEIQSTDDNEETFSVPMTAEGTLDNSGHDQFQQPERPLVDVLFSVDDSGSMSEEQNNLAANFATFIDSATSLDTDYHIGVVTTDSESDQRGKLYSCSGNPLWISDDQSVTAQRAQFDCNVRVSDSGRPSSDSKESPLQAARLALDYPNIDDFNIGFYREEAKLYVILVTDEEDQSDGTAQLYVDYFRNLKGLGNTDLLNISAIAGPPPNGCDTAVGNQVDYDAVNMVGGQFRSICSADWANMVSSLGLDVFNARRQFPLSRPATATTITVEVCDDDGNGNPINCQTIPMDPTNGWTFDSTLNAVTFHGTAIPGPSKIVKIDYDSICFE